MSGTEYVLLILVILVPAVVATGVTLWSLEQVRLRSKRNRKRKTGAVPRRAAVPVGTAGGEPRPGAPGVAAPRGDVMAAGGWDDTGSNGLVRDATKGRKSVGGG